MTLSDPENRKASGPVFQRKNVTNSDQIRHGMGTGRRVLTGQPRQVRQGICQRQLSFLFCFIYLFNMKFVQRVH